MLFTLIVLKGLHCQWANYITIPMEDLHFQYVEWIMFCLP